MKTIIKFFLVFITFFILLCGLAYIHNRFGMTAYLINAVLLAFSFFYIKLNQE